MTVFIKDDPDTEAASTSANLELRSGSVGFIGLLAQSVAGIGPSVAIALILGLVVSTCGNGSWLVWLISSTVLVLVALCISQFAGRFASSGGLYALVSKAGPVCGVLTAWAAVLFSLGSAPILPLSFGLFLSDYLHAFGWNIGTGGIWLASVLCVLAAAWLTMRDVAGSAVVMFVVEVLSLVAMTLIMVIVAWRNANSLVDPAQLTLDGVSISSIAQGVAFTLLAFAAFESALFLGAEAKNPLKQTGRALISSVMICGLMFAIFTYVFTIGFRNAGLDFAKAENPLHDIAVAYGIEGLSLFVMPGVIIALFGVTIANLNFASRLLMTLSREKAAPTFLGEVSRKHLTPTPAIKVVAGLDMVMLTVFALTGLATMDTYGFIGALSGYWVGATYLLSAVAMLIYLRQIGKLSLPLGAMGLAVTAAFLWFFFTSSVPLPPSPGGVILAIFYASLVLAFLHLVLLKVRKSPILKTLGTSARDDFPTP